MKFRLFGLILVIILIISLFSFCVSAKKIDKYNIDFSLPDEFVVITDENISANTEVIKSLGFTQDSYKNYIQKNNIILFASLYDKTCQITVNVNKTDFTEKTETFEYLDNEYILEILPKLVGDNTTTAEIKEINGSKFISLQKVRSDKAGQFCSLQFITVKNQQLYTINFAFSQSMLNSENLEYAENILKNLNISTQKSNVTIQKVQNVTVYIVLILIIVILCAICIYCLFSIINDIINNRNTSDVAPYVKIKRRRFK